MKSRDCVGNEINIHDVDFVVGTKRQHAQTSQEYERLDHVELRCLGMPAIPEDDAGAEDCLGSVGKEHPRHVLAKLLRARVGIVVGAVPLDGAIFRYDFVATLAGHGYGADLAEAAQTVIMLGMPRQREHFERAAQIHVQTTLFRFAIERGGTVDDGVRGMNETIVLIAAEAETGRREVSTENANLGLEIFKETREFQMQLQGAP